MDSLALIALSAKALQIFDLLKACLLTPQIFDLAKSRSCQYTQFKIIYSPYCASHNFAFLLLIGHHRYLPLLLHPVHVSSQQVRSDLV